MSHSITRINEVKDKLKKKKILNENFFISQQIVLRIADRWRTQCIKFPLDDVIILENIQKT